MVAVFSGQSNKQGVGRFSGERGTMKSVPEQYGISCVPKLLPLIIDKISITVGIAVADMKQVSANCTNLAADYGAYIKLNKAHYKYTVKIMLDNHQGQTTPLLVQWFPRPPKDQSKADLPKMKFLRLEWNPSQIETYYIKSTLEMKGILPKGFDSLLKSGSITRIDLAVDIKYTIPGKLSFYCPDIQCTQLYLKSGKIQTAYLGSKESDKQFVIYDKSAEMKKKSKADCSKETKMLQELTRVELRLRPKKLMSFKQLLAMDNPFSVLELVASRKPKKSASSDEYRLLQKVCCYEGVNQALALISDKTKKNKYRHQLMNDGLNQFWEPVKVWQGLPAALENAGFHVAKLAQEIHATPSSE